MRYPRSFRLITLVLVLGILAAVWGITGYAYDSDTHFYFKYYLMRKCGFTKTDAVRIARADVGMDEKLSIGDQIQYEPKNVAAGYRDREKNRQWHAFRDSTLGPAQADEQLRKRMQALFDRALKKENQKYRLEYFGQFLHFLEDMVAHRTYWDGAAHGALTAGAMLNPAHRVDFLSWGQVTERAKRMMYLTLLSGVKFRLEIQGNKTEAKKIKLKELAKEGIYEAPIADNDPGDLKLTGEQTKKVKEITKQLRNALNEAMKVMPPPGVSVPGEAIENIPFGEIEQLDGKIGAGWDGAFKKSPKIGKYNADVHIKHDGKNLCFAMVIKTGKQSPQQFRAYVFYDNGDGTHWSTGDNIVIVPEKAGKLITSGIDYYYRRRFESTLDAKQNAKGAGRWNPTKRAYEFEVCIEMNSGDVRDVKFKPSETVTIILGYDIINRTTGAFIDEGSTKPEKIHPVTKNPETLITEAEKTLEKLIKANPSPTLVILSLVDKVIGIGGVRPSEKKARDVIRKSDIKEEPIKAEVPFDKKGNLSAPWVIGWVSVPKLEKTNGDSCKLTVEYELINVSGKPIKGVQSFLYDYDAGSPKKDDKLAKTKKVDLSGDKRIFPATFALKDETHAPPIPLFFSGSGGVKGKLGGCGDCGDDEGEIYLKVVSEDPKHSVMIPIGIIEDCKWDDPIPPEILFAQADLLTPEARFGNIPPSPAEARVQERVVFSALESPWADGASYSWSVNGQPFASGVEVSFWPTHTGEFEVCLEVLFMGEKAQDCETLFVREILFGDDFSDPTTGWDVYSDAEVEMDYEDGEYSIFVKEQNLINWSLNEKAGTFEDFLLEVDARQVSGPDNNDYGLLLRYQDEDNFYSFGVSGDGYYSLYKVVRGEWVAIVDWTESAYVNKGRSTNRLKVMATGPEISLYVNDHFLIKVQDGSINEGYIGIYASTFDEPYVHVHFDDSSVETTELYS